MPDETYEVVMSGTLAGQFTQNVQHVLASLASAANPFTTAKAILAKLNDAGGAVEKFANCCPADYHLTSWRCRRVFPAGGATAIILGADLNETDGQRAGAISSAQVNPVILWIGTASPEKLGKIFIPGISEDDIDEMTISVSLLGDLTQFANTWIAGDSIGGADTFVGCNYNRNTHAADVIFDAQVSPLIGTQRRRLRPV